MANGEPDIIEVADNNIIVEIDQNGEIDIVEVASGDIDIIEVGTQGGTGTFDGFVDRVAVTGDITLSETTHNGKVLECSADAVITAPNTDTDFSVNFQCIIVQIVTGLTITVRNDPAGADTLNGVTDGTFDLIQGIKSAAWFYKRATTEMFIRGDIVTTP